jgi:hypothetical protein
MPAGENDAGIEIAGYTLAPQLSEVIQRTEADGFPPRCPVRWLELESGMLQDTTSQAPPALQPASALLSARWREAGADVVTQALRGPPFWSTTEISVCPPLLDATLAAAMALSMSMSMPKAAAP